MTTQSAATGQSFFTRSLNSRATAKFAVTRAAAGFTLIELMVSLVIIAVMAVAAAAKARDYVWDQQAQAAADNITVVGRAVTKYIDANVATIPNGVSDITLATLAAGGHLSNTFTGVTAWGSGYTIRIQRTGTVAPYVYKALAYTTTPWVVGGVAKIDLIGRAVKKIGGAGGMTYPDSVAFTPANTAGPQGNGGAWSEPVASFPPAAPYAITGGQLFYNSWQSSAATDPRYLRIDGSNSMTGNLNVGGNNVLAANGVTATGTISGATLSSSGAVTGASVNSSGPIVATGNISGGSLSTAGAVSAGSVAATGAVSAGTSLTAGGAITAGTTITAADDVVITSLPARGDGITSSSLKTLAPRLVEIANYVVDTSTGGLVNGRTIPVPPCAIGGTPNIFIIPQKEVGTSVGGKFGSVSRALPANPTPGSNWTLDITDSQFTAPATRGNPIPSAAVPHYAAVVRTFCAY